MNETLQALLVKVDELQASSDKQNASMQQGPNWKGRQKVSEAVDRMMATKAPSTQRGWSTYARRIKKVWGDKYLDEVDSGDIAVETRRVGDTAIERAVSNGGTGAMEGFLSCCRATWQHAIETHHATENPARKVEKPERRQAVTRSAFNPEELGVIQGVLSGISDPDLGVLVFRLCLETGCRRNEMLGLRVKDLTHSAYGWSLTLHVGTKRKSVRSMPITDELAESLRRMAFERIGEDWEKQPLERLIRNKRGVPITHRWLETTAARVRAFDPALGSTSESWFTWHLLRHTAATWWERVGGFAMASKFLGHANSGNSATGVTLSYTKPGPEEMRRVHKRIWEGDGRTYAQLVEDANLTDRYEAENPFE